MAFPFYESFHHVEKLSQRSKFGRLFYSPGKYLYAILYRKLWLPLTQKTALKKVTTFFNREMLVVFPSGTDIYLTGGKTDNSEIRLTKFLLQNISPDTCFIDIGAHFGYYSLLADACKADAVMTIEPTPATWEILAKNTAQFPHIININKALSDKEGVQLLQTFPHIYSEYNTIDPGQFTGDKRLLTKTHTAPVECITLDILFSEPMDKKVIIKIDAEGSEYAILRGGQHFLQSNTDAIVLMEYICHDQVHTNYRQAVSLLKELGFNCSRIDSSGSLVACEDIEQYMRAKGIKSDNLAFARSNGPKSSV